MKNSFIVLLLSLLLYSGSEAKENIFISNAFYGEDIDKVNYKDAKTAMKIWLDKLANQIGARSELIFYTDFAVLQEDAKRGKVNTLILSPISYLKNLRYCKNNFHQGWIKTERDGKPFFRFVLLSRKDMKKKDEYMVRYFRYSTISKTVAQMYGWKHHKRFTFQKTAKESKPVLDLFFKKCDYAIVKEETWNLMQELNPQLHDKLEVIYKSDRIFIDMISLFSNKLSDESKNVYLQAISAINTTEAGGQLMRLFKFNGLIRIDDNQFKALEDYYQQYLAQKAQHVH